LFLYRDRKSQRLFLGLLLIFSFLVTVPGFYFRRHYFIPMAPAIGMLTGFLLEYLDQKICFAFPHIRRVLALAMAVLVIHVLIEKKEFFFQGDLEQLCHSLYQGEAFAEAVPVARYLEANSGKDDRILVFGSEPEIYFYAKRKSATGYIYMYDLAFSHPYKQKMQMEMMREVEKNKPKFMVAVSNPSSWLAQPGETDALFAWFNAYAQQNKYIPVGPVGYKFPESSKFFLRKDALAAKPQLQNYMLILQRPD